MASPTPMPAGLGLGEQVVDHADAASVAEPLEPHHAVADHGVVDAAHHHPARRDR